MADKKITELTELSPAKQGDLLVIVDSPTGTPITKKITIANLFGNAGYTTPATDAAVGTIAGLKFTTTGNVAFTVAGTLVGAAFYANALSTSTNTQFQYGVIATSRLDGATANVKTEHAGGKFIVDVSNSAVLIANTFGVIAAFQNTGTRTQNTQAFFAALEQTAGSYLASTVYLLETKNVTSNTNAASGNITVLFSNTGATATHKLRARINGADYFFLMASNGSGGVAV